MKLKRAKYYGKKLAENKEIVVMPAPEYVKIPLGQGIGLAASPCVKVGQEVEIGTLLGKAVKNKFCSNVHSSVCGTIVDIALDKREDGTSCDFVLIRSNGKNVKRTLPPLKDVTSENIVERMFEAGIIGQGGAGFPTYLKYDKLKKKIDTVLINGCECDDYLVNDYRLMLERTADVVNGAILLKTAANANKVIICVMKRNKKAYIALKNYITENNLEIEVKLLPNQYPIGNERVLVYKTLNLSYEDDAKPESIGVIVNNVQTAAAVCAAVNRGECCVRKLVTVSGNAIKKPGVYEVAIGTAYTDLIEYCGGEIFPVSEFADIENKAFETYGLFVELQEELKKNKKNEELKKEVKEKKVEADKVVMDYLKLVRKVSPYLLNCLIYGGYETGAEQRDLNYVVAKNSLGVLLLSRKENVKRMKKYC